MKRIILCADDYSQSPAISSAILDLVRMRRLSAVSCLSLSPTWPRDAIELRSAIDGQKAGLHFNLTLPFGQPRRSASALLLASLAGKIDRSRIARAFDEQWHAFLRNFGRPPDFLDGHQHVHSFPIIREVIAEKLAALHPRCSVRSLAPLPFIGKRPPKQRILEKLAAPLPGLLRHHGLPTNPAFAGFRPYRHPAAFRQSCLTWLAAATEGTLIMCHPGHESRDTTDPIRHCRPDECGYLSSPSFLDDLETNQIVLA